MDVTHQEFIAIVNDLGTTDDGCFVALFRQLLEHTEAHFTAENRLMEEVRFPPIQIHTDEHKRMLEEMRRVCERVASGSLATGHTYVQSLPHWFRQHAATMDGALAGCVKACRQSIPKDDLSSTHGNSDLLKEIKER